MGDSAASCTSFVRRVQDSVVAECLALQRKQEQERQENTDEANKLLEELTTTERCQAECCREISAKESRLQSLQRPRSSHKSSPTTNSATNHASVTRALLRHPPSMSMKIGTLVAGCVLSAYLSVSVVTCSATPLFNDTTALYQAPRPSMSGESRFRQGHPHTQWAGAKDIPMYVLSFYVFP